MLPHHHLLKDEYGGSPGNGTTCARLSRCPIATEGEATPGPDDENPYLKKEREQQRAAQRRDRSDSGEGTGLYPWSDTDPARPDDWPLW